MRIVKFIGKRWIGLEDYAVLGGTMFKRQVYKNNVVCYRVLHRALHFQEIGFDDAITQDWVWLDSRHIVTYKRIKKGKRLPYIFRHNNQIYFDYMTGLERVK